MLAHSTAHRSKKEQDRLHQFTKPQQKTKHRDDDLPSIHSHDSDDESWSSDIEDDVEIPDSDDDSSASSSASPKRRRATRQESDEEMLYEAAPRKQKKGRESDEDKGIKRLPIKLQDGRIQDRGTKLMPKADAESDEEVSDESEPAESDTKAQPVEDVASGARFGRPAVVDVLASKSRKARIQSAKEQIAGICQDIIADPENSVSVFASSAIVRSFISETAWPASSTTYFLSREGYYAFTP